MRLQRILLYLGFMVVTVQGQTVHYPVESFEAYQAYRNNLLSFRPLRIDPQFNRFNRRLYTNTDTGAVLEIELTGREEKPLLKCFYKEPEFFYKMEKQGEYVVILNPVLHAMSGRDDSGSIYRNTRGIELMGNIGGMEKGIGFYSLLTENQELMPYPYRYFTDSLNFVPNEFFYKPFKKKGAVDFFQARAYITFNAAKNHVKLQFGHDKHKIGNGYRSLILSDFAPQYLFFKINTDVGRFHYQNLFTQFTDNGPVLSNVLFGKRYAAIHRLSINVRPNIQIGVNEMIIFDRIDSTQANQFDFNYLNPVIFYRSIESNLGSRDNSLAAIDAHWQIKRRYIVYGQFLLDEFNLKFLKNEPNWWANKYAYQIGIRFLDLLKVKNLDVMAEYNRARPYTYSHMRPTQSYSHFNQALAHPLGANFSEAIFDVKYQFKNKWLFTSTFILAKTGRDSFLNGRNYGSNILRSYETRATETNSILLMGKPVDLMSFNFQISYQFRRNILIDARLNTRSFGESKNLFFSFGVRVHAIQRRFDY